MPPEADEYQDDAGVTDPDAGGGQQDDDLGDEPISKEAFIAMRQDLRNKNAELEDKVSLYRTQLQVVQAGGGQAPQPRPEDLDPLHGREDDDVVTVAELRTIMNRMSATIGGSLGELRTAAQRSDYAEVVQNHLPNYLKTNPRMIDILRDLTPANRAELAYTLGTMDPAYKGKKAKEDLAAGNPNVQRIQDNKRKPAPGGKGGGGPLSKASLYESMSDEELEKTLARVKSGG